MRVWVYDQSVTYSRRLVMFAFVLTALGQYLAIEALADEPKVYIPTWEVWCIPSRLRSDFEISRIYQTRKVVAAMNARATLCLVLLARVRTMWAYDTTDNEFGTDNLEKLESNFARAAFDNSNYTHSDIKVESRHSEAQSHRVGDVNAHYVGMNSALIPREMDMPPFIRSLSRHESPKHKVMGTISRGFGAAEGEKSLFGNSEVSNRHGGRRPEIKSRRGRHGYSENPWRNLRQEVIKILGASELSRSTRDKRKTGHHPTQKMRKAGFRVPKSSQLCSKLAVATRIIVRCTKGRSVGSKCSLTCAQGFVLSGKRTSRRCKRPRRQRRKYQLPYWTGKQGDFQCVPVCRHLDLPDHGERTCQMVDFPRGKALQCSTKCDSGYKIVGSAQRVCQENGSWSGETAVCKVASTRQTVRVRFKFRKHQTLPCGESYGLASFRKDGVVYLVAGDKVGGVVKVFRWSHGKFDENPHQTFQYTAPEVVEAVSAPDGTTWLIVSRGGPATMYRLGEDGQFHHSHTNPMLGQKVAAGDTIGFAELRGEFYRCYGRNRRETPVIVVHKLQDKPAPGGDVFHRIMRKKLPGERVHQCSLYTEADSLYTIATLNKPDGQGRIIIGHLTKNRMKVVDIVSGHRLQRVTDSFGFSTEGGRYIAVSQAVENGKCIVYKRHWRHRPPVETG